jgi:PleD family two-component response regulator
MSELVLERPRALPHDTFWSAEGEEGMAKILVIEDDTEIRELLAEILTESGHEVLIAADGAPGPRALRASSPHAHHHRSPGPRALGA